MPSHTASPSLLLLPTTDPLCSCIQRSFACIRRRWQSLQSGKEMLEQEKRGCSGQRMQTRGVGLSLARESLRRIMEADVRRTRSEDTKQEKSSGRSASVAGGTKEREREIPMERTRGGGMQPQIPCSTPPSLLLSICRRDMTFSDCES